VGYISSPNRNDGKFHQNPQISSAPKRSGDMMNTLGLIGRMNMASVNFGKNYAGYELRFSEEELDKRLKDNTTVIKLLPADAPEYKALKPGDKKALKHLVKAAEILNDVFLDMDHHQNIAAKKALKEAAEIGDTLAQKAHRLGFEGMNGVAGLDRMSEWTLLFNETEHHKGLNVYPPGLKEDELKADIKQKFKEDKIHEIRNILSARTVVKKNEKGELYAVDYIDAYPKQFKAAAKELEKAAKVSTHEGFNKYLTAQANAFKKADPELDCEADRLWAKLQDTPLEFTITRENYEDELTSVVMEDNDLKKQFKKNKIDPTSKDSLGIRVGIIDKKGTQDLLDFKKYLPEIANMMPYKDKYTQNIKPKGETKQTAVDARLVALKGDLNYRGGITVAENLPNDDKLSVIRDYGRRNVYHYEIRNGGSPEKRQKRLDAMMDLALHKYDTPRGDHWFTIGHENAHSLGPTKGKAALGTLQNIIEEGKADMGSLFCLDHLVQKGKYNEEEKKEILVSWANGEFLKAKPEKVQAHRVRSVMQVNYFIEKGAMNIDDKGIVHLNLDKMVPTAHQMLSEYVKIQMDKDPKKAETFVDKYFQWTDKIEQVAKNIRTVDTTLHGVVEQPLADKLLKKATKAVKK
jgi:hypothetical protein